jgi:hypothetical protein
LVTWKLTLRMGEKSASMGMTPTGVLAVLLRSAGT